MVPAGAIFDSYTVCWSYVAEYISNSFVGLKVGKSMFPTSKVHLTNYGYAYVDCGSETCKNILIFFAVIFLIDRPLGNSSLAQLRGISSYFTQYNNKKNTDVTQ